MLDCKLSQFNLFLFVYLGLISQAALAFAKNVNHDFQTEYDFIFYMPVYFYIQQHAYRCGVHRKMSILPKQDVHIVRLFVHLFEKLKLDFVFCFGFGAFIINVSLCCHHNKFLQIITISFYKTHSSSYNNLHLITPSILTLNEYLYR